MKLQTIAANIVVIEPTHPSIMQAVHQQMQKHGALPVPLAQSLQYPSPMSPKVLVHPLGQAHL